MAVVAIALLAAAPAAAQQGQPMHRDTSGWGMHGQWMGRGMMGPGMMGPGMMGGTMMGRGMMGMGMHGPGMLLALKSSLGLTDAQVQQIQKIRDDARTTVQGAMQQAMQAHQSAMQALMDDNPDVGAYQKGLQQAADRFVAAQVAMAKAYVSARNVLTDSQRQKLDEGA
ncbi:MAG TPA: Spy/CpxP family protein refolding chaperone, partial [Longimicrobiales bacterium]|nr:Spy/CpxP family protein refolding chaperone [Longimicrobiales bacterium]